MARERGAAQHRRRNQHRQSVEDREPCDVAHRVARQPGAHRVGDRVRGDERGGADREDDAAAMIVAARPATFGGQARDAGARDPDPRHRDRGQPLSGEHERSGRHDQRRQAAGQRIDLAQISEAIGRDEEDVVADVENRGQHQVRPARGGRERQRQHERDAQQESDRVGGAEGHEPVIVALDQRIPRRMRQRRDQDDRDDLGGHRYALADNRR